MTQANGFSSSTRRVGRLALFPQIKQLRLALSFAAAGALSFWLPDVAVHIYAGRDLTFQHVWAITILAPATFLLAYALARRFAVNREFKWLGAAMLLGTWVTGGLFITLAATASGSGLVGTHGIRDSLLMIVSAVIPGVTYFLAVYDGSFLALLAVTVGALLLSALQASWVLLALGAPSSNKNGDKKK